MRERGPRVDAALRETSMFKTGTYILFQEPTSETRLLRSSTVTETEDEHFTVEFGEEKIRFEVGQELLCYFDGEREFMQQAVRLVELVAEEPQLVARLATVGDPISAESRQTYRVSTISVDIFAKVGEERGLSVQDVSATGFAVNAKGSYPIGTTFPVSITFEDDMYSGVAAIQSVQQLRPGRIRYGLHALAEDPGAGDLLDGLHQVSLAVRRERLKRNSGMS
jgi:hypothetical protein